MKIQVLIATMHQEDYLLPAKMNISSDAIVGNQCNRNSVDSFTHNDHKITYLNFSERGVGLNRNNALMRADADICLIADDDMVYDDDYVEKVKIAFEENPNADVIVFNLREPVVTRFVINKKTRVWYHNYLRYGTARIAFKLKSIRKSGIYFNQCFGGGTQYCHGEDNLFLTECLNRRLKIFAVPEFIASLTEERESCWNKGYDDKYLQDQGALYRAISRRWWKLLCLQDVIRKRKIYSKTSACAYKLMKNGAKSFL